jgi:hypothetical protein
MIDRLEPYRHWLGDSMKPSGKGWYMAKCPSHDDKKRSLAINQDGYHHCKADCGEKGDSYLVAQKVGLDHVKYARHNTKNDYKLSSAPQIKPRNSSPEPPSVNGGVHDVYLQEADTKDKKDTGSLQSDIAKYHKHLMENFEKLPWQLSRDKAKGIELGLDQSNMVVIPIRDADCEPIAMKTHKGKQWGIDTKNKFYPAERIAGYDKNKTLIVTAGEHDCEVAIEHFGFQCATVTGGEDSIPSDKYWKPVNGFGQYVIIYDNDSTGNKGADKLAQEIIRRNPTAKVRIARWKKDVPEKWDIADSVKQDNGVTCAEALDNSKLVKLKPKIGEFELILPNQIDNTPPPPVQWFVQDKRPVGYVSLLAGETGSNKSYFAMQEAMSIATKKKFLGSNVPKERNVLFVDTECGAISLKRRYFELVRSEGFDTELLQKNFAMISKRGSFTDAYPEIERYVKERKPDLVYIDNLYTSTEIKDISQNKNLKPVLENILQLMEEYGCTVCLVAHFNKPNSNAESSFNIYKIAGGAFLVNWCEFVTILCRTNEDNLRLMRVVKSRDSEFSNQVYGLEWCPDGEPRLVMDGVYDNWLHLLKDEQVMKHWLRILDEYVPKEGDKFDGKDWRNWVDNDALWNVTERTANRHLNEMETIGLIENIGQEGNMRLWKRTELRVKDWGKDSE